MIVQYHFEVEYFGGPIDGHVDVMAYPLDPFLSVIGSSVGAKCGFLANVFRLLRRARPSVVFPVAVYELDSNDFRIAYRYLGTNVVTQKELNGFRPPRALDYLVRRTVE